MATPSSPVKGVVNTQASLLSPLGKSRGAALEPLLTSPKGTGARPYPLGQRGLCYCIPDPKGNPWCI
jgi:hypothetical protein